MKSWKSSPGSLPKAQPAQGKHSVPCNDWKQPQVCWNLSAFRRKPPAGRIFRLDPAPPKVEDINNYIISAVQENNPTYFTYFLHYYESRLNKRVYRFLLTEGIDRYDPLRFLDYKLSCVLAMLECLPNYDSGKGADFLTYAHHFIGNALLDCRRQEEAGSFKSLDETKLPVVLHGSITIPARAQKKSLPSMLPSRTVPKKLPPNILPLPDKTAAVFRFTPPYRTRTARKRARM